MAVNRYVQPQVAYFNPMSMDELAFAPSFLRQRHDQAAGQLGDLQSASGQYNVLDDYQNVAGQLVDPLQQGIDELANNLATQGVNRSNAVPEALKLKSQYSQLFSPSGGIGQLEAASNNYRAQAQQIQEFFKDSPDLAKYMTGQLRPGQASLNEGQVSLGQMSSPNYVKDIPESEILESLNKAAVGLKDSDLGDFGLQSIQGLNNFDSIATLASGKGVTAQRAFDLITNLVGQDQMQSLYQRGAMQGLTPEQTQENFLNKMKSIATSNARNTVDRDRYKITDELSLDAAKKSQKESSQSFWDYDPVTQELSPLGLDDSYFEIPTREGVNTSTGFVSEGTAARHGTGGTPIVTGQYKPFSDEQKLEAFEVLSSLTGKPISEIPEDYLNSKAGRDKLKEYYTANKGKIQVQPTIDNTDYLKEYGNKPENATADVMNNYQSRPIFDVNKGTQLTPEEFEQYLDEGKISVIGAYSSENPFGFMSNNVRPEYMANPLAAVLKDDDGKIIKRFAIARDPSYANTQNGFEAIQYNSIFNSSVKTPNIDKLQSFTFVDADNQPIAQVPMKVKYNSNDKTFTVSSVDDSFKTFKTNKTTNIAEGIIKNRK